MSRLRRTVLYGLVPPSVITGIDFALRWHDIRGLSAKDFGLYGFAFAALFLFWLCAVAAIESLWRWNRAAAIACSAVSALGYSLAVVGSLALYRYFGTLPSVFTFEYIFDEPADAWVAATVGNSSGSFLLVFLAAGPLFAYLLYPSFKNWPKLPIRIPAAAGVLLLAFVPILHNNVRIFAGAFPPGVTAFFSLTKAAENTLRGHSKGLKLLAGGNRPNLDVKLGPAPCNVLLILNESLRNESLSAFGYPRETSPHLTRFLEERSDRSIRFKRVYADSTRTMLTVPTFVTGVSASQPGSVLHTKPLLFDYVKTFDNVKTFIISSHTLFYANLADFIRGPSLDYMWHRGIAEVEALNATAVDDKYLAPQVDHFLDTLDDSERFVGLVHTRGTHYPYVSDEDALWGEDRVVDRYDNSVRYLDRNVQAVLDALRKHGRLEETLVVFTSDHGESLGEHGYQGHLHTFFEIEARVPLSITLPDGLHLSDDEAATLRQNTQLAVSTLDILPTVLAILGLDDVEEVRQQTESLLGRSLLDPLDPERVILMMNHSHLSGKYMFGGVGLVRGDNKYLLRIEGRRSWEELYDLANDPAEQTNLWPDTSEEVKESVRTELLERRNSSAVYQQVFGSGSR